MPNYNHVCNGCSGEDCACCEVYIENQNDFWSMQNMSADDIADMEDFLMGDCPEDDEDDSDCNQTYIDPYSDEERFEYDPGWDC